MRRLHEVCTVRGCGSPHKARGFCQTHYMQYKRGAPTTPVKHRTPRDQVLPECSETECSAPVKAKGLCHAHYQRLLRHGHTRYRDRKRPPKFCSEPRCEKILYANGRCHQHWMYSRTLSKHGLTLVGHRELLEEQGGVCHLCGRPERILAPDGRPKQLAVDHCHTSGNVRSLLCSACNTALGLFGDDPELLRRAADYLTKHKASTSTGGPSNGE